MNKRTADGSPLFVQCVAAVAIVMGVAIVMFLVGVFW